MLFLFSAAASGMVLGPNFVAEAAAQCGAIGAIASVASAIYARKLFTEPEEGNSQAVA